MKKRFWEYDLFWGVMVLVIFIIGISDPPVWRWIIETWQELLTVALFIALAVALLVILVFDFRKSELEIRIEDLRTHNDWLRDEVVRLRKQIIKQEKNNEQTRKN